MDDALARAAVDLGGRAWAELELVRDPGLAAHALRSFAGAARIGLHVESDGQDEHHVAEAAYKAVGRALRDALRVEGAGIPSTKGRL
jgi:imidazoleglycerol phosphate dehydratase HisB